MRKEVRKNKETHRDWKKGGIKGEREWGRKQTGRHRETDGEEGREEKIKQEKHF